MKTRVGIIGATGYTGLELLRFLIHHPEIEITALTSQKYAGAQTFDLKMLAFMKSGIRSIPLRICFPNRSMDFLSFIGTRFKKRKLLEIQVAILQGH